MMMHRALLALSLCLGCSSPEAHREPELPAEPVVRELPPEPSAPEPSALRATAIDVTHRGCALLQGGRVACWSLAAEETPPIAVIEPDIEDAVDIEVGCPRRADGTLACAGPLGLPPISRLALGCAIAAEDGRVWCWGGSWRPRWVERPGEPSPSEPRTAWHARPLPGLANAIDLSCEPILRYCLAVTRDGRVWSWTSVPREGSQDARETTPRVMRAIEGALSVSMGISEGCIRTERAITCSGPLTGNERVEIPVARSRGIAAGTLVSCAVTEAREIVCWGYPAGPRSFELDRTPRAVEGLAGVVDLAISGPHACALLEDESVWCWRTETPELRSRVLLSP